MQYGVHISTLYLPRLSYLAYSEHYGDQLVR